jgi:AP2-associated kinase
MVGAVFSPPPQQQQVIPDVVPMRRGRPTAGASSHVPKPSPSPMRGTTGDPFAALDSKSPSVQVDEISSRFPSLDQFSLLHEGGKFDFEASSPPKPTPTRDISQRVTEKLADDAFAMPPAASASIPPAINHAVPSGVSRAQKIISSNPDLKAVASPPTVVYQPTPTRPQTSSYVSQGTMTTPTSPPANAFPSHYNPSPVNRFHKTSEHNRSASLPRNQESMPKPQQQYLQPEAQVPSAMLPQRPGHTRHASSSRPSLEGGRPTADQLEPITRTKSSNARPRPASTYLESNMDFLREKESVGRSSSDMRRTTSRPGETAVEDQSSDEETNIASNVDFLKTMEETDSFKKDHRRRSSASNKHHIKRSSLPSLSGTKNLLAGKFGDAFKRFESNTNAPGPRTPSPLNDLDRRDLTPIAGSEATDGRSDDGYAVEDTDGMAPEQRREAERRRLSMEEHRVANAAAEYRKRLAERGPSTAPKSIGGVSRAASIQNKVKNLLDENQQASPKKTAEGYGRFTDPGPGSPLPPQKLDHTTSSPAANPYTTRPAVSRKPILPNPGSGPIHPRTMPTNSDLTYPKPRPPPHPPQSAPPAISKPSTILPRPNAPPKPTHLNSVSTGGGPGPRSASPPKNFVGGVGGTRRLEARPDMSAQEKEDYIKDFSKRFPSLSGIEMVEADIGRGTESRGREI